MKKLKILIIVLFQNLTDEEPYYAKNPAPPLPGILLAGMTPDIVDVEVLHEMVRPIDYNTDADMIAISFMDYLASHAFSVAERFRTLGKYVVGGGKFCTTYPEMCLEHFNSICIGEAYNVWHDIINDFLTNSMKPVYKSKGLPDLVNIPPPRYDLVEKQFSVPIVTEATRGCTHNCSYCQLAIEKLPFRMRPVSDVIRDLKNTRGLPFYKRKMAMLLDNHLGGDLAYAKKLLREIAKLKFWGLGVQFSIECLKDDEFVECLAEARCVMAFIGMESLNDESLACVNKKQNRSGEYRELFSKLHKRGILTFNGLIFALESDTPEYYRELPKKLAETGVSAILPSIAIPIYGTPLYHEINGDDRITDTNLSHYEGDHIVFRHKTLTNDEILEAYREVTRSFYSIGSIMKRWLKFIFGQEKHTGIFLFLFRMVICTFVYFELTVFQKDHANKRVLNKNIRAGSTGKGNKMQLAIRQKRAVL